MLLFNPMFIKEIMLKFTDNSGSICLYTQCGSDTITLFMLKVLTL